MKSLLLFSLIAVACAAQKIRFDNYRVYSAEAANSDQLKILQDLQSAAGVIFWEEPKTLFSKVNIALPPAQVADFLSLTEDAQIKTKLEIENLQDLIDREKPRRSGKADFDWTEFHDVDEIYAWLDGVAAAHPEKITILDIGESYEGRKIKMVKISQKEVDHKTLYIF